MRVRKRPRVDNAPAAQLIRLPQAKSMMDAVTSQGWGSSVLLKA
jgi:hypothetical protein